MIHYRRLVLSLVAEFFLFVLELVNVLHGEAPSVQGVSAMAAVAGAHYHYDSRNKVARAKAGLNQEVEQ